MGQEQCLSERQKDCICIATILSILLFRFFKTIVLSKPISKFFLIAHWDSLFFSLRSGQNCSMDPSLVQQAIANRFFVSNYWHHGIPLWNQYSGFGMPLVGDPQTFIFSPIQSIFTIFPGIHTWELLLILEMAVGTISTYLLCRQFELNSIGSLTAALLFIFCPWLQLQFELLGQGICFVPLVFLVFVKLGKANSFSSAVLAGIVAAIDILSGHPEIAFITILSATILVFLVAYYNDCSRFNFISNFYKIAVAAFVAFGISAPMLIPFAEYLVNGESYKTTLIASAGLPLQAIVCNYLFPFYAKGSIFFGPLSWWGLAAALCFFSKSNRFAIPLIVCLCASIVAVTRFMPFEILFTIPPLSMTFATYCLPEYILFMSIVSGLGTSCLIDNINALRQGIEFNKTRMLKIALVSAMVLVLLMIPLLLSFWHHNNMAISFDQTFEPPRFHFKQWLFNAYFVIAMLAVVWLAIVNKALNSFGRWKILGSFIFVILGISNLIITSLNCVPITPAFSYPTSLPLAINKKDDSRIVSTGNHLFKPNTNLVYGLPMVQVLNPLFPKGFLEFIQACGGQVDQYTQTFPLVISRLLNLTGVRTILSVQPILDESTLKTDKTNKNLLLSPIDYDRDLRLDKIGLLHDSHSGAIFFRVRITSPGQDKGNYYLCFAIENIYGKSVSFIEPASISASLSNQEIFCSGFVPKDLQHWQVSMRVLRGKDCRFVSPIQVPFGAIRNDGSWLLGNNSQTELFTKINNNRFQLLSSNNGILAYKDRAALDRYFFVKEIKWVEQRDQALSYMKEHAGQLSNIAVFENSQRKPFENMLLQAGVAEPNLEPIIKEPLNFDTSGTVKKLEIPNATNHYALFPEITLQTDVPKPALLVISNLYFPGWIIYLDGRTWQMFRADYLLQSVVIPSGRHILRFEYRPISFLIGAFTFISTIITLLACAYLVHRSMIARAKNA